MASNFLLNLAVGSTKYYMDDYMIVTAGTVVTFVMSQDSTLKAASFKSWCDKPVGVCCWDSAW